MKCLIISIRLLIFIYIPTVVYNIITRKIMILLGHEIKGVD